MISNWKPYAAGLLVCSALVVWIPKFLPSGGSAEPEPPAEYWESGATEPWDGVSFTEGSTEQSGADTPASSELVTPPSDEPVGDSGVEPESASDTRDPLDPDRLLSVARALRGVEADPVGMAYEDPTADEAAIDALLGGRIEEFRATHRLSGTMLGEDERIALIEGMVVREGESIGTSGAVLLEVRPGSALVRLGTTELELAIPPFRARSSATSADFDDFESVDQ